MNILRNPLNLLSEAVLGRTKSIFADDIAANHDRLMDVITGRELLIIGAAGSIGQAFVKLVSQYHPRKLILVDINENSMVELVRDLRSTEISQLPEFATYSIDFGSTGFYRLLEEYASHDYFLNFAAMKHVRSERDPFSLMRMIDINVRALHQYLDLAERWDVKRAFSVSTDKVVRPTNLMGATKNLMEQTLFAHAQKVHTSTARFANVAFSNGSLLQGFQYRFSKNQPIAAPSDIKRYFISHDEAGQLCLLAAFLGENRAAFFPRLDMSALTSLSEIAGRFLQFQGYEALVCGSDEEAKAAMGKVSGKWPCHFAPSDTTGEKQFEEFYRVGDDIDYSGFSSVGRVIESPGHRQAIAAFLEEISQIKRNDVWRKSDITNALRRIVPELDHTELDRDLDQKM
ncbi:MAG: polysaccharide biosynthesis protein [Rhodospirillales bacterium]|nr:polysaccharide biosynthesis protein [Rhodospirillales bacterium]